MFEMLGHSSNQFSHDILVQGACAAPPTHPESINLCDCDSSLPFPLPVPHPEGRY